MADQKNSPSLIESIAHIEWTLERSPKSYALFRDRLISIRQLLVNLELQHQENTSQNAIR